MKQEVIIKQFPHARWGRMFCACVRDTKGVPTYWLGKSGWIPSGRLAEQQRSKFRTEEAAIEAARNA